ncbi:zinc finger protein 25-like isoform X2 [Hemicordylus capensis]|uniref:zinc finger protein 25-like isoform X2 n=1 Tax=Hemicordylus capensis TaxID=884348 RepID=UPI0023034BAE|nr:zinc finger protein 25-like isoform X2 [Hemicordylus capensis]
MLRGGGMWEESLSLPRIAAASRIARSGPGTVPAARPTCQLLRCLCPRSAGPGRQGGMAASGAPAAAAAAAQVMFEDVAVYFSPAEWAELAEWQRDLYRAVMVENYEVIASLGRLPTKPEVICKIEREEEPCMDEPPEPPQKKRPLSPWLGDGIRMEEEEGEGERAGPARRERRSKVCPARAEKPVTRPKMAPPQPEEGALPRVTLKMNPPKCPECGKSFLSNVAMTIHIRTHTGERPFACHLCPKAFPSRGDLTRHLKTHLRQKEAPGSSPLPKSRKCLTAKLQLLRQLGAAPGPKKPHTCPQCGKSFSQKQDLRKHQGTHSTERPFSCLECGRSFRLKQILVAHMKVHVGERPHACPRCGKRFSQECHVESHQRVHTGEKPFSCGACGKSFGYKQHLVRHLRVHTGERPFGCEECGKAFRDKTTLAVHHRMHSGERPYRCPFCGKACRQKPHLNSHLRVHRGEQLLPGGSTGLAFQRARAKEKPHQCPECEKRFRDQKIMLVHQKTHREERLLEAGAGLGHGGAKPSPRGGGGGGGGGGPRQKQPVSLQPAAPTAKRSAACSDCGKTSTQRMSLTMHQRSHRCGGALFPRVSGEGALG